MGCTNSQETQNDAPDLSLQNDPYDSLVVYKGITVGLVLLCRDQFRSKYSGETLYRWRKATVVDMEEPERRNILIHFVGWAETFDQWIDLDTEWRKLAPMGMLSQEQIDIGHVLSDRQIEGTNLFLLTGENPGLIKMDKKEKVGETRPPSYPGNSGNLKTTGDLSGGVSSSRGNDLRENSDYAEIKESEKFTDGQYYVGQMIDVLDVYYRKGTTVPSYKWREAQIVGLIDSKRVRVHFVDWDPKFDETLDTVRDARRISPYRTKSTQYRKSSLKSELDETRKTQPVKSISSVILSQVSGGKVDKTLNNNTSTTETVKKGPVQVNLDVDGNFIVVPETNEIYEITSSRKEEELLIEEKLRFEMEAEKEKHFIETLRENGLHVIDIVGDGNCLFRAVSHQLYLDEDHHEELRRKCVEHMTLHRKRFEVFCPIDWETHIKDISNVGTWGDDLEIRALEEVIDRVIIIYSSDANRVEIPINNNFEELNLMKNVTPLNLSYHGKSHYNSVYDEKYPLPVDIRTSSILLKSRMILSNEAQYIKMSGKYNNSPNFSRNSTPHSGRYNQQDLSPHCSFSPHSPKTGEYVHDNQYTSPGRYVNSPKSRSRELSEDMEVFNHVSRNNSGNYRSREGSLDNKYENDGFSHPKKDISRKGKIERKFSDSMNQ